MVWHSCDMEKIMYDLVPLLLFLIFLFPDCIGLDPLTYSAAPGNSDYKNFTLLFYKLETLLCLCVLVLKRYYFSLQCEFCTLNPQHVSFLPRLINVTIDFQLKAINIQTIINNEIPDCYTFAITVSSSMISNSVNIPQNRKTKNVVFYMLIVTWFMLLSSDCDG